MKFYTLDLLKHLLTSRINATLQMSNTLAVSQSVSQSYVGTHSKCELQTFVVFFLLHLLSDHKSNKQLCNQCDTIEYKMFQSRIWTDRYCRTH